MAGEREGGSALDRNRSLNPVFPEKEARTHLSGLLAQRLLVPEVVVRSRLLVGDQGVHPETDRWERWWTRRSEAASKQKHERG